MSFKNNIRSFLKTLLPMRISDADVEFLREFLTKQEQILFYRMVTVDQRHSLYTAYAIRDMLGKRTKIKLEKMYKAALLHDVGKAQFKLYVRDRVLQTLFFKLLPPFANYLADRGSVNHEGYLRRMLFCYKYHARLGAEMTKDIKVEEAATYLIEHHHDQMSFNEPKELSILREADDIA
jgi:putative nucleotidyltransferase with HDIG domain